MQLFDFDNSYARLPERFFASLAPTPVSKPRLIKLNADVAQNIGIDPTQFVNGQGLELLAGNHVPANANPIAQAYAGHQFGGFSPQLGDGRAILLGEVIGGDGNRYDVQLKGSGPTPFSRRGDGRAALGPVLREYIISEAMAALGVPTTRSLAVVATGETVMRETPLPGAILTRIATSHIRVGTFQYFAAREDIDAVRILADYAIDRHDPDLTPLPDRYRHFLDRVIARQASLVARWLALGFIHGVMNTDNMTVSGETIDYGPCAFMDTFSPGKVFSSIDREGRYAWGNQPRIALWNLTRLAETLLPLLNDDEPEAQKSAQEAIDAFGPMFQTIFTNEMRAKLGLLTQQPDDLELAQALLQAMTTGEADFTRTFRALSDAAATGNDAPVRALFTNTSQLEPWLPTWQQRLAAEAIPAPVRAEVMKRANPIIIPRNHRVEEAIAAATERDDLKPFEDLLAAITNPYSDSEATRPYTDTPKPDEIVHQTFCGT